MSILAAHVVQLGAQDGQRAHARVGARALPLARGHRVVAKGGLDPRAADERLVGVRAVVADDGGVAADDVAAARHHARVEHAALDGVAEALVVHLDRVQHVGVGQHGVHVLVGLGLVARLAGADQADVAVGVDKGRRDDGVGGGVRGVVGARDRGNGGAVDGDNTVLHGVGAGIDQVAFQLQHMTSSLQVTGWYRWGGRARDAP